MREMTNIARALLPLAGEGGRAKRGRMRGIGRSEMAPWPSLSVQAPIPVCLHGRSYIAASCASRTFGAVALRATPLTPALSRKRERGFGRVGNPAP